MVVCARATVNKTISTKNLAVLQHLLREIRSESGLRQEDIASRLGEPQSFVSKYESGERRLDLIELKQICDAIGISLAEFVQRYEKAVDEAQS